MTASRVAWIALALNAVAAAVGIARELPADFLWIDGERDEVARELLTIGTAIAPPLVMMIALAGLAWLAPRSRRALAALTAIFALGIVGYLGEPITWEARWEAAFSWIGILLYGVIVALGVRELRRPGEYRAAVAA